MSEQPIKTLSAIFADTDTITQGPFTMTKPMGQSFDKAQLFMDGHHVRLADQEKRVMSVFMANSDATLSVKLMNEALEQGKKSGLDYLQIYVCKLRLKMETALLKKIKDKELTKERLQDLQGCFKSANPVRSEGEKGHTDSKLKGAYKFSTCDLM